jgi:hypothetical protein
MHSSARAMLPAEGVAGHALFSKGDAARWRVRGLARVRDTLPGMRASRTSAHCTVSVALCCRHGAQHTHGRPRLPAGVCWCVSDAHTACAGAALRGSGVAASEVGSGPVRCPSLNLIEAVALVQWQMPLLNACKEPIWQLWVCEFAGFTSMRAAGGAVRRTGHRRRRGVHAAYGGAGGGGGGCCCCYPCPSVGGHVLPGVAATAPRCSACCYAGGRGSSLVDTMEHDRRHLWRVMHPC